jgi:hypothetical protein
VALEHRQDSDVVTGDAVDDSIGPQKNLADVIAPELRHDAARERCLRRQLRLLDEPTCPAFGGLAIIARDEAEYLDQVVA